MSTNGSGRGKDQQEPTMTDGNSEIKIPAVMMKRVNALRNLQIQSVKLESELFNKIFHMEKEFFERITPLLEKRKQIINGDYEPSKEECDCSVALPPDNTFTKDSFNAGFESSRSLGSGDSVDGIKGIPGFWLQVMKNADPISALIQEYDEPVLQHLVNVDLKYDDVSELELTKTFTIIFSFNANKYFKNDTLSKEYKIRVSVPEQDPFDFEGPEIVECKGCKIDWYPNMNVTERVMRRRKTNRNNQQKSLFVSKTVPRDSFFHFFSPPVQNESTHSFDDIEDLLEEHYEIGHFMREKLIPNAILFYTGETPDAASDYDDDDDDEEEEEDEDNFDVYNQNETESDFTDQQYSDDDILPQTQRHY